MWNPFNWFSADSNLNRPDVISDQAFSHFLFKIIKAVIQEPLVSYNYGISPAFSVRTKIDQHLKPNHTLVKSNHVTHVDDYSLMAHRISPIERSGITIVYTGPLVFPAIKHVPLILPTGLTKQDTMIARTLVRAREIQRMLALANDVRILDVTGGRCTLMDAFFTLGWRQIAAISVYDFPQYNVERVQKPYKVYYKSYSLFNLLQPQSWRELAREYDLFMFNAHFTYVGENQLADMCLEHIIMILMLNPNARFLFRMSNASAYKIVRALHYFKVFDVFQFASVDKGDLYLYFAFYNSERTLDIAHLHTLYCGFKNQTVLPLLWTYLTPQAGTSVRETFTYVLPAYINVPLDNYPDLIAQFCESAPNARRGALEILYNNEENYFYDLFCKMAGCVSMYPNETSFEVYKDAFGDESHSHTLTYFGTSPIYASKTTQNPHSFPFQNFFDELGFQSEFVVPVLDVLSVQHSLYVRLRDVNPLIEPMSFNTLIEAVPYYAKMFKNVDRSLPTLETMIVQSNKSSSVGHFGKLYCSKAPSMGRAFLDPRFCTEIERLVVSANKSVPFKAHLIAFFFCKNKEILKFSIRKVFEGRLVARLLCFFYGPFRVALATYFWHMLCVLKDVGDGLNDRPCVFTTVGNTPMQVAERIVRSFARFKNPVSFSFDLFNWDCAVQMAHQLAMYDFCCQVLPEYTTAYSNYYFHQIFKVLSANGSMFLGFSFHSTGAEDNTIGNTLMNAFIFHGVMKQINIDLDYFIVGDDATVVLEAKHLPILRSAMDLYLHHGMYMKEFVICTDTESISYASHGYTHFNMHIFCEIRPLREVFSKLSVVWQLDSSSHRDRYFSDMMSKTSSYFFLYFYTLEVRLFILNVWLTYQDVLVDYIVTIRNYAHGVEFDYHTLIFNFDELIAEHYREFAPNLFARSKPCIHKHYEKYNADINAYVVWYDKLVSTPFAKYLPKRTDVIAYFNDVTTYIKFSV